MGGCACSDFEVALWVAAAPPSGDDEQPQPKAMLCMGVAELLVLQRVGKAPGPSSSGLSGARFGGDGGATALSIESRNCSTLRADTAGLPPPPLFSVHC
jgi:hypothetical protein